MSTTSKITNLLNRQAMTVQQVATALGISRNSAHLQIQKLEAAGTIEKREPQKTNTAGKPAHHFKTTAGREDTYSSAYKPVLDSLLQTISAELPEKARLKLLENAGQSLAKANGLTPAGKVVQDIQKSVNAVNALGAMAEITTDGKHNYVTCHSCPVATLVHHEPMTCRLVAAFFAEATGRKVSVQCKKNDTVVCGFKFN